MRPSRIHRYVRHGTLPQLAVFEASARLRSFTRAAEELHLAQPTVSAQIRKMTETVGLPLFEQIGKQIYLTDTGRRTYAHCQEIFRTLESLDDVLTDLRGVETGRLCVAVTTTAECFVPRLLAGFARRHPGIDVSLRIHNRRALIERMANNEDDLYVFANPPEDREVVRQAILPNPMVVFARAADPLVRERSIPLARLVREPFLMREPGSGTRMVTEELFARYGLAPTVRMELSTNEAIKQAILAGLGVAILSRDTLGLDAGQSPLATLDVVGFPLERHWHFVYPVGRQLSPAAESFMDYVRIEAPSCGSATHMTSHRDRYPAS
jgi:DNA-binding transcriptional LysR family regulator